ncbi:MULTISPECIES: toxin YdaT family protein [Serratia]|uniref:Protein of uncharacterized function (DUF1019) n=1 Tax=Serratia quinivorans TaxID=137545 RepID=A0A379YCB7_9GAMM|nr:MULTISPECIES: toxin YdaT family protein [Serratia]RYM59056.1 hypothetical protein BSR03_20580 [Serratia proteamaculans]CAI1698913.1 Protein of uncharacterised function (DUF1019) [Serratia quinivorans]SUI43150.1 Protein of uncharacterised function (DUF1019) [Serratia quinivorans]
MEIKHEHIASALFIWSRVAKQEVITALIAEKLHEVEPGSNLLQHPDESNASHNNRQKIFRVTNGWVNGDTEGQRRKLRMLLPAIEKVMPPFLVAKMWSYSSDTYRDLVTRKERIDGEVDALFGAMIAMSEQVSGNGPAGSSMCMH